MLTPSSHLHLGVGRALTTRANEKHTPGWLQAVTKINPLSYEVDALRGLLIGMPANLALDVTVLVCVTIAGISAAAMLLPRLAKG